MPSLRPSHPLAIAAARREQARLRRLGVRTSRFAAGLGVVEVYAEVPREEGRLLTTCVAWTSERRTPRGA